MLALRRVPAGEFMFHRPGHDHFAAFQPRPAGFVENSQPEPIEHWRRGRDCLRELAETIAGAAGGVDDGEAVHAATDHLVLREIGKDSTRYINAPGKDFMAFFPQAIKL